MAQEENKGENASLWLVGVVLLVGFVAGLLYRRQKKKSSSSSEVDFSALPVCTLVKTHAKNPEFKLNDEQWEELKREMDVAFNNFTDRLLDIYPKLNDVELHVCYLLKLKISPTDIAHIVVRQKNTVSTIRERLYKKIYGENGTAKQFDQFIERF